MEAPLIFAYITIAICVALFQSDYYEPRRAIIRGVIWPVIFVKAVWRELWS